MAVSLPLALSLTAVAFVVAAGLLWVLWTRVDRISETWEVILGCLVKVSWGALGAVVVGAPPWAKVCAAVALVAAVWVWSRRPRRSGPIASAGSSDPRFQLVPTNIRIRY